MGGWKIYNMNSIRTRLRTATEDFIIGISRGWIVKIKIIFVYIRTKSIVCTEKYLFI